MASLFVLRVALQITREQTAVSGYGASATMRALLLVEQSSEFEHLLYSSAI